MYHILYHTPPHSEPKQQWHHNSRTHYIQELEQQLHQIRHTPSILQAYSDCFEETRLVALDLDGTLTSVEFMQEIAPHLPHPQKVEELYTLTHAAVEDKAEDWADNFTKRVKLLEGLPESTAQLLADEIPLTQGAEAFIQALHERGITTAIITGAYHGIAHSVAQRLGIKHLYCSTLQVHHQQFTGEIIPPLLTPEAKATALRNLLHQLGLSTNQCTAIGDSYNDLPMLTTAGQALLYHAIQPSPLPLTDLLPFI